MPKFAKGTPTDWQWVEIADQDVPSDIARDSEVASAIFDHLALFFGDGSDGDVVISTNKTLGREMVYNNLTVNAGVELDANNYRIYVRGTLTNNGVIHCNGRSATDRFGAAGRDAYMQFGRSGRGGNGGQTTGSAGSETYVLDGGLAGRGGAGGSGSAGAGGSSPAGAYPGGMPKFRTLLDLMCMSWVRVNMWSPPYAYVHVIEGGCGGGGGGGDGTNYGGGGGSGGGVVWIAARKLINNGVICARGGNGYTPTAGNCGGGGGGGGGAIVLIYREKSGSGSYDVSGGQGGSGCGSGTPGANGQPGQVREFQV